VQVPPHAFRPGARRFVKQNPPLRPRHRRAFPRHTAPPERSQAGILLASLRFPLIPPADDPQGKDAAMACNMFTLKAWSYGIPKS
jgi:hypothetical protein